MNIVRQKIVIYNNKIKESAELIFESYSASSENVGLTLVLAEFGRYQFQGSDFYKALFGLRALLEPKNIVICINGCRLDFVCSSMGQQMSRGQVGYIIEMGKQGTNRVRTFDYCDDQDKLTTVNKQMDYIRQWSESLKG
ncbi:hypothetical protein IPZ60_11020 [Psychrobacter sp. NG25]|uniref:hypothetical protein n=1 Tax=Psychrobacter TaxID=497 RepID=UPI0018837009|nr:MULTISPECIES: hypothetical protein [Psychrobacter]MBF0659275.1 hypothetical protein [Psychrobacter sp. NG25]